MPHNQDGAAGIQHVSLAGVKGRVGLGLRVTRPDTSLVFTAGLQVLGSNPARRWALIQNIGTTDINASFDSDTAVAADFIIPAKGVLQIDSQLPWTGPVSVYTSGTVTYIEASVQT